MKLLILTGPESTGKTTLAQQLSNELNINLIDEYARTYLEARNGQYTYPDLSIMAKNAQNILTKRPEEKLILDTDMLTYKVWSEMKYMKSDPWINENLVSSSEKLYLLCYPDIDWSPDPLRENPTDRPMLFAAYEALLIKLKLKYFIICGKNSRLSSVTEIATDYFNF